MKKCLPIVLVALSLVRCTFDDDSEFFLQTSQAFFLISHEGSVPSSLLRVSKNVVTANPSASWGVQDAHIGDIAQAGSLLWVSDLVRGVLVKVNPENNTVESEINLEGFLAHYLCVGEDQILLADTLKQTIRFVDLDSQGQILRDPGGKPGIATYRSGKFYLQVSDSLIAIYQEQSFSKIAEHNLALSISSIQVDLSSSNTFVYGGGPSLRGYKIDFNTDAPSPVSLPVNVKKILHSTVDTRRFDKELTDLATLFTDGSLLLAGNRLGNIDDIAIDFFENQAYIQHRGEWYRRDLRTGEEQILGTIGGNFRKSVFYQDFIGN